MIVKPLGPELRAKMETCPAKAVIAGNKHRNLVLSSIDPDALAMIQRQLDKMVLVTGLHGLTPDLLFELAFSAMLMGVSIARTEAFQENAHSFEVEEAQMEMDGNDEEWKNV